MSMSGMNASIEDLESYPRDLFMAVIHAVPSWVARRMLEIASHGGVSAGADFMEAIESVSKLTMQQISGDLLALLTTDVDQQRFNPLQVIREANVFANQSLAMLGVPVPPRDEFDTKVMPHDSYAVGPLTWKDLSEEVHDAGISWGAWKAATVLTRRRAEGKIS
jgi:hypothetical protein